MSNFERIYQIDPLRECPEEREKHLSIELSDSEHLERNGLVRTGHYVKFNKEPHFNDEPLKVSKEMEEAGFVYKEPVMDEEAMSPALKEKFKKARKICQDTKVIDLSPSEPPKIPMKLEMPELEKAIKQGKKNAKSKSKSTARKPKKDNPKSNKPAVESLQAQL